jgi:hypothetical protein
VDAGPEFMAHLNDVTPAEQLVIFDALPDPSEGCRKADRDVLQGWRDGAERIRETLG